MVTHSQQLIIGERSKQSNSQSTDDVSVSPNFRGALDTRRTRWFGLFARGRGFVSVTIALLHGQLKKAVPTLPLGARSGRVDHGCRR